MDEIDGTSICETSQYGTLSKVVRTFYLERPSGERILRSKPGLNGQIGVPQLVDKILGKIQLLFINQLQ